MTVIVIDDDPVTVTLLERFLDICDYPQPETYRQGKEALDVLRPQYRPSAHYVIFLDLNMPVMDGWEFLDSLHPFASAENMQIYVVTSSVDERDRKQALASPFVRDYLVKPVLPETLTAIKKNLGI
ncbi:MAG: response regulator [Spirochaetaceae bacterium]|nr:response regulator [Spirochaetaceae bacterium]|tara:strand:+ start:22761 stop:23138 length:378 start_codon:yes stop_codon:yes gene_type:complete